MDIFHSIIFGIVEGLTEFLPVSSTGHLILTAHILRIAPTDFLSSFEIAIQLGAILAVLILYGRSLFLDREIFKRVAVAFLPTAVIGFVLYKFVKHFLLKSSAVVLWSLFLGGVVLIVFERLHRETNSSADRINSITYRQAFWIGVVQSLAVVPGVSRSAATIVGGLMMGIPRSVIVEFSFLLAVPTLLAATGFDLMKSGAHFSVPQIELIAAGFAASLIVAMLSIKFLMHYIKSHNFTIFGIYRILLATVFCFMFWSGRF